MSNNRPNTPPRRLGISRSGFDVVTLIIAVNVAVFAVQQLLIHLGGPDGRLNHTFNYYLTLSADGLRLGYYWQIFTHMFLHGGTETPVIRVFHLALNMIMIHTAGKAVLEVIGSRHVIGLYFAAGTLSGLAQIIVSPESNLMGASGAAFGLIIAFTTLLPWEDLTAYVLGIPFNVRARTLGWSLMITNASFIAVAHLSPRAIPFISQVAHTAHFAGGLAGFLYVRAFSLAAPALSRADLDRDRIRNDTRVERARRPQDLP